MFVPNVVKDNKKLPENTVDLDCCNFIWIDRLFELRFSVPDNNISDMLGFLPEGERK